jgi:hypothetical protein
MHPFKAKRPRLSVNILTCGSHDRLAVLVAEVREFADEVLIGVDASSEDATYELAKKIADIVYRFRLPGQLSPARMLVFDYATGDWILSLDDDESMEKSFDAIVPKLISDASLSHVWFPRKWIVGLNPCEYIHAQPWFPNWTLRLFRNDRALVWKPSYAHSQYYVQGTGWFEERTSVLHLEPILATQQWRARKIEMYRRTNGPSAEEYYSIPPTAARRPAQLRPAARHRDVKQCTVDDKIHQLAAVGLPPWRAEIADQDVPRKARAGEQLMATFSVRNTGKLKWTRPGHTNNGWPYLQLGYHLLNTKGEMLAFDNERTPLPRSVELGEQVMFFCGLTAPSAVGEYLLEWDMVSENDCWFSECGSPVLRTALRVL